MNWEYPPEKPAPLCPECGDECETIYTGLMGDVLGCDSCLEQVFACDYGDGVDTCPICGYACDMLLIDRDGNIVGCDFCVDETGAYDYKFMEDYR